MPPLEEEVQSRRDAQHSRGSFEQGSQPPWLLLPWSRIWGSFVGLKKVPKKASDTFPVIDLLPHVVQVGFQNPTERELAGEGDVGVFTH